MLILTPFAAISSLSDWLLHTFEFHHEFLLRLVDASAWQSPAQPFDLLQGVYEPHHDISMQPYPEGAAGQGYTSQGYSSSSLPAQQTSSSDRMHPGLPAAGKELLMLW